MNKYVKEFLKRGLMFSGLGPIVAGIVYLLIEASGTDLNLDAPTVFMAIITTYIIAFVQAGSSIFNSESLLEEYKKAFKLNNPSVNGTSNAHPMKLRLSTKYSHL